MHDTRFVAVLGMHRSGTSAVTRALNLIGVTLPGELMHNTQHNRSGHWEALEAVRIHDALLAANSYSWDDPFIPHDICVRHSDASATAQHDIARFLEATVSPNQIAALKDPRICHMLPLWQIACQNAQIAPCAVIMVRNPLEVAASLTARDHMPFSTGIQLWLRYMLAAERNTRGMPRVVVSYDQLVADWQQALAPVCGLIGLTLPDAESALGRQLSQFLNQNERHHTFSRETLASQAAPYHGVYACYTQSLADINEAESQQIFDAIQHQINADDAALPAAIHELMRYHRRQVHHEIATLKAEITWRAGIMDAQAEEIAWRKSVMVGHNLEP